MHEMEIIKYKINKQILYTFLKIPDDFVEVALFMYEINNIFFVFGFFFDVVYRVCIVRVIKRGWSATVCTLYTEIININFSYFSIICN